MLTHLFLDLDDTLYSPQSGIWEAVGERISQFMIDMVGMSVDRTSHLREEYFRSYGTTLSGLIANHQTDPHVYMAFVHDVPIEEMLDPDPQLQRLLEAIDLKKIIFTNADRAHSMRVLSALGIEGTIDQIVDYFSVAPSNKPELSAYSKALELCNCKDPSQAIMVDDQVRNLIPARELGMKTVLVNGKEGADQLDLQVADIKAFLELHLPSLLERAQNA
jgi:putative hydrolase of the HAD superfamily